MGGTADSLTAQTPPLPRFFSNAVQDHAECREPKEADVLPAFAGSCEQTEDRAIRSDHPYGLRTCERLIVRKHQQTGAIVRRIVY